MLRKDAHPGSPPPRRNRGAKPPGELRQSTAPGAAAIGGVLLAPFALALAALAGVVYVVLLPICGIASIAGATARASWALVRDAFRRGRREAASRA